MIANVKEIINNNNNNNKIKKHLLAQSQQYQH